MECIAPSSIRTSSMKAPTNGGRHAETVDGVVSVQHSPFAQGGYQSTQATFPSPAPSLNGKPMVVYQQGKGGFSGRVRAALKWYSAWALPGLGMLSEAYIVFSAGQIQPLQQGLYPNCFNNDAALITDCNAEMVQHVASYIQICGIIAGMLLWGYLGDITGRMWGSRLVAAIMLSGCVLLTFTPYAGTPMGYFAYFMTAQTWYGFGVGGEYPMSSSSAAERASTTPELRQYRGRQVLLVFSNQGLGNLVNTVVIVVAMALFGQTGSQQELTRTGCRKVLLLVYGVGAVTCLVMVLYRSLFLTESTMFHEVSHIVESLAEDEPHHYKSAARKYRLTWRYYWHRQLVASAAWLASGFVFYGSKLQQTLFLALLFPDATPYAQLQWAILNSFIALLGYYAAACLVDKPWYGRRTMQIVGFMAMFVFNFIIYGQWHNMGATGAPVSGARALQTLYYLTSFFNQLGPNTTTYLVPAEIFPTDIRTTMHGVASAMGKVGAIIAALWISYIADKRKVFLVTALFCLAGAVVTYVFLPDTTGLELEEYDRMQRYILEGRFSAYHGEAVNPRHLSPWELYVLKWSKSHSPHLDVSAFGEELKRISRTPAGHAHLSRMTRSREFSSLHLAEGSQAELGQLSRAVPHSPSGAGVGYTQLDTARSLSTQHREQNNHNPSLDVSRVLWGGSAASSMSDVTAGGKRKSES